MRQRIGWLNGYHYLNIGYVIYFFSRTFCSFSCCFYYVHWRNRGRLLFPLSATTNLQWVINYWGFWFAKEPGAWALAAPAAISWTWPKRNAVDRSPEHCFWPSNRPLWQHGVWLQRLDECRPFLLFRCRLGGGSVQNRITDYTVHALLYCLEKSDIFYLICLMGKRMRILSPSEELVAPYFQTNRGGRWNIRGCAFSSLLPVGWSLDQDGNTDARMWFQTDSDSLLDPPWVLFEEDVLIIAVVQRGSSTTVRILLLML